MKTDTQKFLEALKDPTQVKIKEQLIEMLNNPDCKVLNVEHMQMHPDDYRVNISITAK